MANLETGSISVLNDVVTANSLENFGTAGFIITGTWVGTITIQGSLDGSTFFPIAALNPSTITFQSTTAVNVQLMVSVAGFKSIQAKMTSYTSGTANIAIQANSAISIQNSLSYLAGNADGTRIGNIGDRLKVDANISTVGSGTVATFSNKVRADITTTVIAVTSNVTYSTLYSYSGTGKLMGFNVEFNGVNIVVKLVIDGEIIFDGFDLSALNGFLVTADAQYRRQSGSGIITQSSSLDWSLKHPITFSSNITIAARLSGGASKNFQQGIFYISKDS